MSFTEIAPTTRQSIIASVTEREIQAGIFDDPNHVKSTLGGVCKGVVPWPDETTWIEPGAKLAPVPLAWAGPAQRLSDGVVPWTRPPSGNAIASSRVAMLTIAGIALWW